MKKLLQLLNEYKKGESFEFITYDEESKIFRIIPGIYHKELTEERIISKKFGFIQWLVENNKTKEVEYGLGYTSYSESDNLIRLLSIQDDPIEFLVSVLR